MDWINLLRIETGGGLCCVLYLIVYCTPYICTHSSYLLSIALLWVTLCLYFIILCIVSKHKHHMYFVSVFCITIVCSCVLAICTA